MTTCAVCGNEYDQCFTVAYNGDQYAFDSFECAIEKLAPRCAHCQCRVIGHGLQSGGTIFCCAHCASQSGAGGLRDRV